MSISDFLMGSSNLPGYLQELNEATAKYNQNQMTANQNNWTNAANAAQLGANSDIGYATATGSYLNSNPYINQVANATTTAIMDNYNNSIIPDTLSQYAASGRYGSGGMQNAMTTMQSNMSTDIGNAVNDLYYQNYNDERAYMEAAQNRLGQQYDSLSRYNTYSNILNAGRYNTMNDVDTTHGFLDIVGKITDIGGDVAKTMAGAPV